eukprot:56286-Pleurochrysis_carterae.AAC.1
MHIHHAFVFPARCEAYAVHTLQPCAPGAPGSGRGVSRGAAAIGCPIMLFSPALLCSGVWYSNNSSYYEDVSLRGPEAPISGVLVAFPARKSSKP